MSNTPASGVFRCSSICINRRHLAPAWWYTFTEAVGAEGAARIALSLALSRPDSPWRVWTTG